MNCRTRCACYTPHGWRAHLQSTRELPGHRMLGHGAVSSGEDGPNYRPVFMSSRSVALILNQQLAEQESILMTLRQPGLARRSLTTISSTGLMRRRARRTARRGNLSNRQPCFIRRYHVRHFVAHLRSARHPSAKVKEVSSAGAGVTTRRAWNPARRPDDQRRSLGEHFIWCTIAETAAWRRNEPLGRSRQRGSRSFARCAVERQKAVKPSVCVFNATLLPRTMQVAESSLHGKRWVVEKLGAAAAAHHQCHGPAPQPCRKLLFALDSGNRGSAPLSGSRMEHFCSLRTGLAETGSPRARREASLIRRMETEPGVQHVGLAMGRGRS